MLSHSRSGSGPPLLLLHGTPSSSRAWTPVLAPLEARFDVVRPDFPGFGASATLTAAAPTPHAFADAVAELLDALGWRRPRIAGHSMGGWVALELAKRGRAEAIVALAPAGLWTKGSPRLTDLRLNLGLAVGRRFAPLAERLTRYPAVRALALRDASASPRDVPAEFALATARDTAEAVGWRDHFRATRPLRFEGGQAIDVPVTVAFGDSDRIAIASKSQRRDELPAQTRWVSLPACGHMVQWDAPKAAIALIAGEADGDAGYVGRDAAHRRPVRADPPGPG